MKRSLETIRSISDGKLYRSSDMAKLGVGDCVGCTTAGCCVGMSDTIVLDPFDAANLSIATGKDFQTLLKEKHIRLTEDEGLLLPILSYTGDLEKCTFLDENFRCSVHSHRPGICRLFPLGRIYREDGFDYFLQEKECAKKNRTKVRISKWLGLPNVPAYETYIFIWHSFCEELKREIALMQDDREIRSFQMDFLKVFYRNTYDPSRDLCEQVLLRIAAVKAL